MSDYAPKTMMSPGPPRRGRGPLFFVALLLLGIVSIAAGAIVVLFFVLGKAGVPSVQQSADARAPAPSVAATPVALDAAPAVVVTIPSVTPSHVAAASTKTKSVAASCLCLPKSGSTNSLCPKEQLGPSKCSCTSIPGSFTLCTVPWKEPAGCTTQNDYGNTVTARDGDPCNGFNGGTHTDGGFSNEKLTGGLHGCLPCVVNDTYAGKIGTPCVGYRNDRQPVNGVVDCGNLEFDCKRGDVTACNQLASHK